MSILTGFMKTLSGGSNEYKSKQLLFDKVVGVRGIVSGVGATTVVYNLAAALADNTNYHVCVLDTHILYPTLRGLLVTQPLPTKDWFDFSTNVSEIVCETKFRNVSYIGFYNRNIADVLSTKECRAALDNLLGVLKEIFDVILVDLSSEYTNIATHAAIQCNKIYTVVSPEPACMFGFKTSINTAVSLAVPPYKLRNVIFNKSVGRLDSTMLDLLKENYFEVIATIPYSTELVRYNLLGNAFWGATTRNADITAANNAMQIVLKDTIEETTLNTQYVLHDGQHNLDIPQEADESGIKRALDLQEQHVEQRAEQYMEQGNTDYGNANSVTPAVNIVNNRGQQRVVHGTSGVRTQQRSISNTPNNVRGISNTGTQAAVQQKFAQRPVSRPVQNRPKVQNINGQVNKVVKQGSGINADD